MGLLKSGPYDSDLQRAEISLGDFFSQSVLLKVCFQRARRMQCERAGVVHRAVSRRHRSRLIPRNHVLRGFSRPSAGGWGNVGGVCLPIVQYGDYPLCDTELFG